MEDGEEAISCLASEGVYSEFVSCPPPAGRSGPLSSVAMREPVPALP